MPLLFESGTHRFTRPRVLVACDEQTQQKRLMARNGLTAQQASARISSQMPLEAKRSLADIVVDNNGDLDATREQVNDMQLTLRKMWSACIVIMMAVSQVTTLIQQLKAQRWRQHLIFSPISVAVGIIVAYRTCVQFMYNKR